MTEIIKSEYEDRTEYTFNSKLQRDDSPACDYNESKYWYQNDILHRLDGPLVEWEDGSKYWYQNGVLHRTDGPAVEYANGTKAWYQNGKCHRTDGPAVEYPDGIKEWYFEGKLHRIDGPALEYSSGRKEWYFEGINYDFKEYLDLIDPKIKVILLLKHS